MKRPTHKEYYGGKVSTSYKMMAEYANHLEAMHRNLSSHLYNLQFSNGLTLQEVEKIHTLLEENSLEPRGHELPDSLKASEL